MSATTRHQVFTAVHTIGALLPTDTLTRIAEGKDIKGASPADYGVVGARSVRDDAERHWDYLKAIWRELRAKLPVAPEADLPVDATGLAIAQWLEPLFAALNFGRLTALGGTAISSHDGSKTFPISHRWTHVPIHLAPWHGRLDKVAGVGTIPPQSMVQECLNRTDLHLWAVLSNGRQLRLLRDSSALATASYVEFDLEAIFDGELFNEFVLLYRLLHSSRFAVADDAPPSGCWLETWRQTAIDTGIRALDHHRDAVREAITTLGTGFLQHPANAPLREQLDVTTFHAALLRLVYRLIFLFVTEDRDALHPATAPAEARRRYAAYFSSQRLRQQANRRRGTAHTDLYQTLQLVLGALGNEDGRPELGLPGLGGIFDDADADTPLRGAMLANMHLLEAVRYLDRVRDGSRWRRIDYRNIGSEELGSIYESLLELVPKHSAVDRTFELSVRPGNERKKTGSYYTPSSLIERLLDSTLDPVIDDAQKRGEAKASGAGKLDPTEHIVTELLALTVCDPACGSGHFLVAAARRIAKRVAAVRERNPEPTTDAVQRALHEVVGRCVYGVDLNPMAAELAKVSLWLEAIEPGKALGFLDARIKHGDGLIGATPALLRGGIPNKAFKSVEGDEPAFARQLEARNEQERAGQDGLFDLPGQVKVSNATFAASLRRITLAPADDITDVHRQAAAYDTWRRSADYAHAQHVADAWCAAFLWQKARDAPPAITEQLFRAIENQDPSADLNPVHAEIHRLRDQYHFFHWHLEFPDIFTVPDDPDDTSVDAATGWTGGFSCVLANPPWDRIDFEDLKYFNIVDPAIAAIPGAARGDRIATWATENPEAGSLYRAARRRVKGIFHFASKSSAFPHCQQGLSEKGVNSLFLDHLFAERLSVINAADGRAGCIVPTTIATGAGAQHLFGDLTRRGAVASLYDFENGKPLFLGVHASYKFCLLSLVGHGLREPAATFAFFLQDPTDLDEHGRVFALSPEEIALLNPNTGNLPIFRTRRDADLVAGIYRRIPVLWDENDTLHGNRWKIRFKNHFNMKDDSDLFRTREQLDADGWKADANVFVRDGQRMLPLYEGKMAHHFDHRWSTYLGLDEEERRHLTTSEKSDPSATAYPRYWVAEAGQVPTVRNNRPLQVSGVSLRFEELGWEPDWVCGWRDVARATDERTAIPAFLARNAVGHTFPLMLPRVSPVLAATLIATQSSLIFDYVSRQKIGGIHMALMTWKQLPVPAPDELEPHAGFIVPRVLELVYTAYDIGGLAKDLGDADAPFRWDEQRRALMRAELDGLFFHLYGIAGDDVDYILETFQTADGGLKNNEIRRYGTYRTKDLALAAYDRMAPAGVCLSKPLIDGESYVSPLDPLPGHGPRHPPAPAAGGGNPVGS